MSNSKSRSKIGGFFAEKGVSLSPKVYFVDAMGAMAFGLFASLLIGTIFGTIGEKLNVEFLTTVAGYAKQVTSLVYYCDNHIYGSGEVYPLPVKDWMAEYYEQ